MAMSDRTGASEKRSSSVSRGDDHDLRCSVCGAALSMGYRHKHENRAWKPRYDDFEGALEGYESERIHV